MGYRTIVFHMTNDTDQHETPESRLQQEHREELQSKRLSDTEQKQIREAHQHHLIRPTTSKLTNTEKLAEDIEADTAEIPDTYCFTCEEWLGFSGVNLQGRPRSRKEAYYLGGPPESVQNANAEIRESLADLTELVVETVPHITTAEDALNFIGTELERAENRVQEAHSE